MTKRNIRILKFFLHVSKEEQKRRFLARLDDPQKNWKFSAADVHERGYWDEYQQAYEDMLGADEHGGCAVVRHSRPIRSGSRGRAWRTSLHRS